MPDLESALRALTGQYALVAVYASGSRADEIAARVIGEVVSTWPSDPDVDIGVLPERDVRLDAQDRVSLMLALEDLFAVSRVDLVILPEAPPYLAADVVRGRLLYAADTDIEAEYQIYVLRRAGDLAPFERERLRAILYEEAF
jgi:predicted nucleotidyltransferase